MRKLVFSSLLIAWASFMSATSNAASLSPEEFTQYGIEEAYWVVKVDCEDGIDARVIQRKTDGNQWCSKDMNEFCSATKTQAADKVCGQEFSASFSKIRSTEQENERKAEEQKRQEQALEERRRAEANAVAARQKAAQSARQKNNDIDERLFKIEQEKLSLRRQELELQRRAVEIRDELKALDN